MTDVRPTPVSPPSMLPPSGYLPRPRFQLKYTAGLVGVAVVLMLFLGVAIERITAAATRAADSAVVQADRAAEASRNSSRVVRLSELQRGADDPEVVATIERELGTLDREALADATRVREQRAQVGRMRTRTLAALLIAAAALSIALGVLGVALTRSVLGPMFRLKRLLRKVTRGKLDIRERLDAGDEISELFNAFMEMVDALKRTQAREIDEIEAALREAEATGASESLRERLIALKSEMEVALQPPDATHTSIRADDVRAMVERLR